MAKLTIVAALLVALVALAQASTYRTIVTTTTIKEEDQSSQGCRERLKVEWPMLPFVSYLSEQGSSVELLSLRMSTEEQQHLQKCCHRLEHVEDECRCEAVREIVRHKQGEGKWQGEEIEEVIHKAKYLPSRCNLGTQPCAFRAVWF